LKKKILVKTDDPDKKQFNLVVTGKVETVVDIMPRTVSLSGAPGDVLEARVTITPAEKYGFSILELTQKFNTNIKAQLIKPDIGNQAWQVKISSTSQKTETLYDVITLKTDSKYKPTLKIRVYATYFKKDKTKS
jgi:predicted HNH restriction endonuclease